MISIHGNSSSAVLGTSWAVLGNLGSSGAVVGHLGDHFGAQDRPKTAPRKSLSYGGAWPNPMAKRP